MSTFSDTELKKLKLPTRCKRCRGYGYYAMPEGYTGIPVSMSIVGLRMGFHTSACPECKANPHPHDPKKEATAKK